MTGASIAAEVAQALTEVASDVGTGTFTVILVRTTGGSTPWDGTSPSETTYDLAGMVSDYPRSLVDGTLIKAEDRRVMLAATGERPLTTDKLRIASVDYEIVRVRDMSPSGVPLYYEVQARR